MTKPKTSANPGATKMREALLAQPLFCHKTEIIDRLIKYDLKLERVTKGTVLIKENDFQDRDIFCVVSGRFTIDVGGHVVNYREKNIHIGEMAMILDEARTASATASEDSMIIRIPENVMWQMYEEFPEIWKPVAKTLCERLHQRKKFFRAKNKIAKVFIGSSGASLKVAKQLARLLRKRLGTTADVQEWTADSIFTPSSVTITELTERAKTSDFGIFIFAADDNARVKGKRQMIPRDNVIFEGGMFTAACGLNRTFFVGEDSKKLHLPTDLAGVTILKFSRDITANSVKFGDAVKRIADEIQDNGVI